MAFRKIDEENKNSSFGKKCILIYGYEKNEFDLLTKYSNRVGISKIILISNSNYSLELDEIINEKVLDNTIINEEMISEKFIILSGVTNYELNTFIHNFKVTKLVRPLFATITENNIKWKFNEFISEIIKEHEEMKKINLQKNSITLKGE